MSAEKSGPRSSPAPFQSGEHELSDLRRRAVALARPPVKCPSPAADECSDRAASAYRSAVNALPAHEWSVRKVATAIKRSTRLQQDFVQGARDVPMACVLRLPEQARVRFLAEVGKSLTPRERAAISVELLEGLEDEDSARVA